MLKQVITVKWKSIFQQSQEDIIKELVNDFGFDENEARQYSLDMVE